MAFYNQHKIEIKITSSGYRISHLHIHVYNGRVYLDTVKLSGLQLIDSMKERQYRRLLAAWALFLLIINQSAKSG